MLRLMDEMEVQGLDVMSAGAALAWATEAFQTGLVTSKRDRRAGVDLWECRKLCCGGAADRESAE